MILVIGAASDPHVATVLAYLEELAAPFTLIDVRSPSRNHFHQELGAQETQAYTVVWWRLKPSFYRAVDDVDSFYNQSFVSMEWRAALNYYKFSLSDIAWVNPLEASQLFIDKLSQLMLASKAGFRVPRTVISSDVKKVSEFAGQLGGRLVHKTITPYTAPTGHLKYSSVLKSDDILGSRLSGSVCPAIYQELIQRQYEVRAQFVGDQYWAVKIKSDSYDIDWRSSYETLQYELIGIPEKILEKLDSFRRASGLVTGAIDLIVDHQDDWCYLECNPAGQWLWLEEELDMDISRKLATWLADKSLSQTIQQKVSERQ